MKEIILAYQGEMTLKGLNRGKFEARLAKIIRWRLEPLGKFKVYQAQSTVFIEPLEENLDMDEAFRRVSRVFGIVKMSRAVECDKEFSAICETAEAYLGQTLRGLRTFKVEAKRADKSYPMKSPEICRELGAYLLDKHHHLRVDVHHPQLEIMVEIRDHAAYVHGPKVEAAGGLPVGTSGRALNLLSGGIDSPVQPGVWRAAVWRCITSILPARPIPACAQNSRYRNWPRNWWNTPATAHCSWYLTPNPRNISAIMRPMCCSRCSCAAVCCALQSR